MGETLFFGYLLIMLPVDYLYILVGILYGITLFIRQTLRVKAKETMEF
jgi:hypothetical protein